MSNKKHNDATIAQNRRARFEYNLEDVTEAGILLEGWEVKSLRAGRVQINESHVVIRKGEIWLLNAIISPLMTVSTHFQPQPSRSRKLLLKKKEINHLIGKIERRGYTVVPLSFYWKKNKVKVKIALAKGKKEHDKRASVKEREWRVEQGRLLKNR